MNQVQCPRFHLYHLVDSVDGGCPVCATQETDLSKTRSLFGPAGAVARRQREAAAPRVEADHRMAPARHARVGHQLHAHAIAAAQVVLPLTLAAHDRIELGSSALVFVPLVGARFSWAEF